MRNKHHVCVRGAAVRLYGHVPARVVGFDYEPAIDVHFAICRVTRSRPGYKTGDVVRLFARDAVPRDEIYRRGAHLYCREFLILAGI